MSNPEYRSYIVRIRRRIGSDPASTAFVGRSSTSATVRAEIEDLLAGIRARIDGDGARTLAADLEALLRPSDAAPGPAAENEPLGPSDRDTIEPGAAG